MTIYILCDIGTGTITDSSIFVILSLHHTKISSSYLWFVFSFIILILSTLEYIDKPFYFKFPISSSFSLYIGFFIGLSCLLLLLANFLIKEFEYFSFFDRNFRMDSSKWNCWRQWTSVRLHELHYIHHSFHKFNMILSTSAYCITASFNAKTYT